MFEWLVRYHCEENLPKCLPHIRNGRYISPFTQTPLNEGTDENDAYIGVLILSDGTDLLDNLVENEVITGDEDDIDPFEDTPDYTPFQRYINNQQNSDGAYVFNAINQIMARVYELNNNPKSLSRFTNKSLLDNIPPDFVTTDRKDINPKRSLGTKTRLAIKLPLAYDDVDAFQIKRTAYTPLGMGKVTHFTRQGLKQEFFFKYEDNRIIGVHRTYDQGEMTESRMYIQQPLKKVA